MNEMIKIKRRIELFQKDNIPAHIVTVQDYWYNGYIVEANEDHLVLLDRKKGKVPLMHSDIKIFDFFVGDLNTLKKLEDLEDEIAVE